VTPAAASDDVVGLTLRLVAASSPNPPGDERAAAAVLLDYLAGTPGLELTQSGPRPERVSVIASSGAGERALILAGHLDTHPVVGEWRHDPHGERVGDRLYGRGTSDIKGGLAAMAVAFRIAIEQGLAKGTRLVIVGNADEETGGAEGIAAIVDDPALPLAPVVVAEPSGAFAPWETLYLAARGTTRFTLRATGTRTHSSLAGRDGVESALERLEHAIARLRGELRVLGEQHPVLGPAGRMTVVRIAGGDGYGVVPGEAEAQVELRVAPGATQDELEREIGRIATASGVDYAFAEGGLRWMAPSDLVVDHPLALAAAAAWREVFGKDPTLGCFPGGTDSRLFQASGRPALGGIGPGALVRAHHPDEYVEIAELTTAVQLYGAIIRRYLSQEAAS
jgi:acetylornithine deacetylase/succinyl-diaminopimelate desuccinylase-like protein